MNSEPTSGPRVSRRKFSRRLAAYTAAASAGAVSSAEAAPMTYTPPGGPQTLAVGNYRLTVDLNSDATTDYDIFLLDYTQYGSSIEYVIENFGPHRNMVFYEGGSYLAKVFAPGETVGPQVASLDQYGYFGNFAGVRGYVGVLFDIPGGSPHYGYLDLEIAADRTSLTLYGGGWESEPNTAIQIPIPEPAGLALLASGSAGVAAWRRRRALA